MLLRDVVGSAGDMALSHTLTLNKKDFTAPKSVDVCIMPGLGLHEQKLLRDCKAEGVRD